MTLFHVYNQFDSMDLIHVYALSEEEAVRIALADGYLTDSLGVPADDVVAYPFSHSDQTSDAVRRISSTSAVICGGSL